MHVYEMQSVKNTLLFGLFFKKHELVIMETYVISCINSMQQFYININVNMVWIPHGSPFGHITSPTKRGCYYVLINILCHSYYITSPTFLVKCDDVLINIRQQFVMPSPHAYVMHPLALGATSLRHPLKRIHFMSLDCFSST